VEPGSPRAPDAPEAPVDPVAPQGPYTPVAPDAPVAPEAPVPPKSPICPGNPRSPVDPCREKNNSHNSINFIHLTMVARNQAVSESHSVRDLLYRSHSNLIFTRKVWSLKATAK
jgi:hypothetical protein